MSLQLLSPTAVLLDGVPLGNPAAAIATRPALALDIANAMVLFERQQTHAAHIDQLAEANDARAAALAAAAESATQVTTLTAEVSQLTTDKAALETQVAELQAQLANP